MSLLKILFTVSKFPAATGAALFNSHRQGYSPYTGEKPENRSETDPDRIDLFPWFSPDRQGKYVPARQTTQSERFGSLPREVMQISRSNLSARGPHGRSNITSELQPVCTGRRGQKVDYQ